MVTLWGLCRRMLGSKLVKKADFDTDFETQTLELLKLRFLESELHHCDVMLKDMQVPLLTDTHLSPVASLLGTVFLPPLLLQSCLAAALLLLQSYVRGAFGHKFIPTRYRGCKATRIVRSVLRLILAQSRRQPCDPWPHHNTSRTTALPIPTDHTMPMYPILPLYATKHDGAAPRPLLPSLGYLMCLVCILCVSCVYLMCIICVSCVCPSRM